MTFVPFTRDALTRIKNGATPAELGWDETFYLRICREHGILPNVLRQKTHTLSEIAADPAPPLAPKPISSTQAKRPAKIEPPAAIIPDTIVDSTSCVLNLATRQVTRHSVTAKLARQQTEVLRYINKGSPEVPISGREVGRHLKLDQHSNNVGAAVSVLRVKLGPLQIELAGRKGKFGGGYWLLDVRSKQPLKLTIVGGAQL